MTKFKDLSALVLYEATSNKDSTTVIFNKKGLNAFENNEEFNYAVKSRDGLVENGVISDRLASLVPLHRSQFELKHEFFYDQKGFSLELLIPHYNGGNESGYKVDSLHQVAGQNILVLRWYDR